MPHCAPYHEQPTVRTMHETFDRMQLPTIAAIDAILKCYEIQFRRLIHRANAQSPFTRTRIHQVGWKRRIQIATMRMCREAVLRLTVSNRSIIKCGMQNVQDCTRAMNEIAFTLLCRFYRRHRRNVKRDCAYRRRCFDFPSNRFAVEVLTGRCTPILGPNPTNAAKNKRENETISRFQNFADSFCIVFIPFIARPSSAVFYATFYIAPIQLTVYITTHQ